VPPPAPTCFDGVKNGEETGVDCGGTCDACQQQGHLLSYILIGLGLAIMGGAGYFLYQQNTIKKIKRKQTPIAPVSAPQMNPLLEQQYEQNRIARQAALAKAYEKMKEREQQRKKLFENFEGEGKPEKPEKTDKPDKEKQGKKSDAFDKLDKLR
jgi:hypothetical protein